jgi:hypothetical protein
MLNRRRKTHFSNATVLPLKCGLKDKKAHSARGGGPRGILGLRERRDLAAREERSRSNLGSNRPASPS